MISSLLFEHINNNKKTSQKKWQSLKVAEIFENSLLHIIKGREGEKEEINLLFAGLSQHSKACCWVENYATSDNARLASERRKGNAVGTVINTQLLFSDSFCNKSKHVQWG